MQVDSLVGGMMMVSGAANALTGGVTANESHTVTGDSSASVQVTNVINANDDGGTAHTIIEKTINGVKTVEEETKHFAPGEPINVKVKATASSNGSSTVVHENASQSVQVAADINADTDEEASTTDETTGSSTDKGAEESWNLGSYLVETISGIWSSVWSFIAD